MTSLNARRFSAMIFGAALSVMAGSSVAAGNLIINPGMDTSLGGWSFPFGRTASWSSTDARGIPDSGSAVMVNEGLSNGATPLTMTQCVTLSPRTNYTFGARTYIPARQPAGAAAVMWVYTYASSDCGGTVLADYSVSGSTAGAWELQSDSFTAGSSVHSAYILLGVWKSTGVSLNASGSFDDVFVRQSGGAFAVGPSMSASWYNPSQSGHGIMLEFMNASSAWMCWFAFDLVGNRSWICGVGNVSGNSVDFPDAFTVSGGKFPPLFDPAAIAEVRWGSITVAFTGCDAGTMTWTTSTSGFTSGSMPVARLTSEWGNTCP